MVWYRTAFFHSGFGSSIQLSSKKKVPKPNLWFCSCGVNQFCTHVAAVFKFPLEKYEFYSYHCFLFDAGAEIIRINFFFLEEREERKETNAGWSVWTGIRFSDLPQSCLGNCPVGPFWFVSQPGTLCSDWILCPLTKTKTEQNNKRKFAPQFFSEDPYIYIYTYNIYIFVKALRRKRIKQKCIETN